MKILVHANALQYEQFLLKGIPAGITPMHHIPGTAIIADVYFDLLFDNAVSPFAAITQQPVFVNAVDRVNADLAVNYMRINAWPGFWERPLLEIVKNEEKQWQQATAVLEQLGWPYQLAPDTPGMIAARIVSMIINEAYFALGENISSKKEIDIAMRSGTNYPFGPFEWADMIGVKKVYFLLEKLSLNSSRYEIAPELARISN